MKVVFVLVSFALIASAQPPDSLWSRTFGGGSSDKAYSVIATTDGGYLLTGDTYSLGAGGYDILLIKTNANGDSLWSRTYGGSNDDYCTSVAQTADGGYVLAGFTYSFGAGSADMWLVKTDANGDSLWSRTFGGSSDEGASDVQVTADGGYVLAGGTISFGTGNTDMYLVKTDANGDSIWSRTFGGSNFDYCNSVLQTADGGYILAGYTASFGAGGEDMWLVKTDANGDSLWSRTFGGSRIEHCTSFLQTTDGGYVLAGGTASFGAGDFDMWLLKTGADGDSLWSRTFGGSNDEQCYSVLQTADGGYVLAGGTYSFGAGSDDMWLVKTDANGDSLWSRTFGGSSNDWCNSVLQTTDGGYALAGYTNSFPTGDFDMWLVKTGPDPANAVSTIPALPDRYALTVYPNPFNSSTTIAFSLARAGVVTLALYDITGRRVQTLINEPTTPGDHQLRFEGSELPSGVYFLRLQTRDHAQTQKLMLLK